MVNKKDRFIFLDFDGFLNTEVWQRHCMAAGLPTEDGFGPGFNPEVWFADMVRVTKSNSDKPERVVIWASSDEAPYICTKPFHPSQRILELREDGAMVFELNIIVNRELVRLILGYAEGLKVLTPRKLSYQVRTHLVKGAELYQERV